MIANPEKSNPKREIVRPNPSFLIEGMRDIGYSLKTAICDLIDNSLVAGAQNIEILTDMSDASPAIGILDDGTGMTKAELLNAMRAGSCDPRQARPDKDLGRFGLGLKTASFSQCRRLTVLTRKNGELSCARWDLDVVAETNEWFVELPDNTADFRWADKLNDKGTLVIWEKLDRLVDSSNPSDLRNLIRQINCAIPHIELVFHRFLSGEKGLKPVEIVLVHPLVAFDPFNSQNPATIAGPEEVIWIGSREVKIQSFTLPHHMKVEADEWERLGRDGGYIKNQGFYLYREKRLIIYGTWFNLAKKSELTKLARVRIDIPNCMDSDWKIDVKKASAQPPAIVRRRLEDLVDYLARTSKRVYTGRGYRLIDDGCMQVWLRVKNKNEITYQLNLDHPVFKKFSSDLSNGSRRVFLEMVKLIESTLPIGAIYSDEAFSPGLVSTSDADQAKFESLVEEACRAFLLIGIPVEDIQEVMFSEGRFSLDRERAKSIIASIIKEKSS